MLFFDAGFNVFAGDFHVTNCVKRVLSDVRQTVAVALLLLNFESCFVPYGVMRSLDDNIILCYSVATLFFF